MIVTKQRIAESELVINPDGSAYHIHLKPEQVAETIITVGDPGRVEEISKHFDSVQHKLGYREFVSHTGYLNNKRLTVISTGIGTDNVDIVMNELDALVNIDFKTHTIKDDLTSLDIIRIGTSGSVSDEVDVDSIIISENAIGMEGLLNYYEHENTIEETAHLDAFNNHIKPFFNESKPYIASCCEELLAKFETHYPKGTTLTASGFYAPQGRRLRLESLFPDIIEVLSNFRHEDFRITNLEMETAAIYGMGKLLGHRCLSINAILAHRANHHFSANPKKVIDQMIEEVLEILTT